MLYFTERETVSTIRECLLPPAMPHSPALGGFIRRWQKDRSWGRGWLDTNLIALGLFSQFVICLFAIYSRNVESSCNPRATISQGWPSGSHVPVGCVAIHVTLHLPSRQARRIVTGKTTRGGCREGSVRGGAWGRGVAWIPMTYRGLVGHIWFPVTCFICCLNFLWYILNELLHCVVGIL